MPHPDSYAVWRNLGYRPCDCRSECLGSCDELEVELKADAPLIGSDHRAPSRQVDLDRLRELAVTRAAQSEVAWDLGVSLPDGHPFAPIVDGGAAA